MSYYNGNASLAFFNTVFTLIKPYIPHIRYWEGLKRVMSILQRTGRRKMPTSLNPRDKFF